eukprot:TRINITY_DN4201_c0_g1_i1.p1 TRINITY_DN4201_c0_g1~~TRINITY_DN4201_c0_g1_i1.p1  ORF type:complete len:458 (-),score=143.04 TRINITY_DN4201_c0_g1_i1:116-1465(-)
MQSCSAGKVRHFVDLLLVSFCLLLIFLAFNGTQTIESSIVPGDLGYLSLAVLYLTFAASALLLSTGVVSKLTPKWSIMVGSLGYVVYIGANLYPRYYTLIPGAVLVGVCASILWAGEGAYVTNAAMNYSLALGLPLKSSLGLFNGVFFGIFQLSMVIGNILSSVILGTNVSGNSKSSDALFLVYVIVCVAGLVGLIFLPHERAPQSEEVQKSTLEDEQKKTTACGQALIGALKLMRDKRMALLIPLIFYCGLEQGFTFADFTDSIISEVLGIQWVGYIMCLYGATNSLCSVVFGKLVDVFGKRFLILLGVATHGTFFIFFVVFPQFAPLSALRDGFGPASLWIWSAALGVGDAVLFGVFCNAIIGSFFGDHVEEAFSNLKLWQSLGYFVGFAWGPYLPVPLKCLIITAVLIVSVFCVGVLDRVVCPVDGSTSDYESLNNCDKDDKRQGV